MSKYTRFLKSGSIAAVLALVPALSAPAAVTLVFSDNNNDANGNNTTTTVNPGAAGSQVVVTLRMTINGSELVSGTDYALQTSVVPAAGGFTIQNRDFAAANGFPASSFPDPTKSNAELGIPGLALDPKTPASLGSGTSSGTITGSSGTPNTVTVATYTFNIKPFTTNGTYTISSADSVWQGPPLFGDNPFNGQASYAITVVPEPSGMALAGIAAVAWLGRRRRRVVG